MASNNHKSISTIAEAAYKLLNTHGMPESKWYDERVRPYTEIKEIIAAGQPEKAMQLTRNHNDPEMAQIVVDMYLSDPKYHHSAALLGKKFRIKVARVPEMTELSTVTSTASSTGYHHETGYNSGARRSDSKTQS